MLSRYEKASQTVAVSCAFIREVSEAFVSAHISNCPFSFLSQMNRRHEDPQIQIGRVEDKNKISEEQLADTAKHDEQTLEEDTCTSFASVLTSGEVNNAIAGLRFRDLAWFGDKQLDDARAMLWRNEAAHEEIEGEGETFFQLAEALKLEHAHALEEEDDSSQRRDDDAAWDWQLYSAENERDSRARNMPQSLRSMAIVRTRPGVLATALIIDDRCDRM